MSDSFDVCADVQALPNHETICYCMSITKGEICKAIQSVPTLENVRTVTSASTGCGSCKYQIQELILSLC